MVVDPEVYKRDRAEYKKTSGPKWRASLEFASDSNIVYASRPRNMHKFIMDIIRNSAEKEKKKHMRAYDDLVSKTKTLNCDENLVWPFLEAERNAKIALQSGKGSDKLDELGMIIDHVKKVRALHRERIHNCSGKNGTAGRRAKNAHFTSLAIEKRQDILRSLSKEFASGPKDLIFFQSAELDRVRASYAYLHDWEEMKKGPQWSRFPWDVAMRELCGELKSF